MLEIELLEDALEDELQSALAVGHASERRIPGLVLEELWRGKGLWILFGFGMMMMW
jgi:hypothetical protein